jgi:citrate lyase subunit beta/citryl-CoA lyase
LTATLALAMPSPSAIAPPARRSCLSVPGSSGAMLAKASTRGADEVIIDLEDAVAITAKEEARATVVAALSEPHWEGVRTSVRINAPGTPWCHSDVAALASHPQRPDSIIVPKVQGSGDLAFIDRLLDGVEAASAIDRPPLRVQALIENAAGVAHLGEIAGASVRLDSLILGYADLSASLGRAAGAGAPLDCWRSIQDALLVAARTHDIAAIDGPYLGIAVDEGFTAAAQRAREMGFDGKWAIHPAQVAALNALFTPSVADVEQAQAIIAALEAAERDGARGAVALDGQMLDEAVRLAALRVLARAGAAA